MRIAVVDDEQAQRELIGRYARAWAETADCAVQIVSFNSSAAFLFAWEDDSAYDLLILDIGMPGELSGMELAGKLRSASVRVPILFVTGFEQYMAQGYEVEALHYLLKPLQKAPFFAALSRAVKKRPPEETLLFRTPEGQAAFVISAVWFIEAAGHRSVLHTADGERTLAEGITALGERLAPHRCLISCHRSILVNLQHVAALERRELVLDDGRRLPVSRSLAGRVQSAFVRWYHGRADCTGARRQPTEGETA